jgi:hypothetical protein
MCPIYNVFLERPLFRKCPPFPQQIPPGFQATPDSRHPRFHPILDTLNSRCPLYKSETQHTADTYTRKRWHTHTQARGDVHEEERYPHKGTARVTRESPTFVMALASASFDRSATTATTAASSTAALSSSAWKAWHNLSYVEGHVIRSTRPPSEPKAHPSHSQKPPIGGTADFVPENSLPPRLVFDQLMMPSST